MDNKKLTKRLFIAGFSLLILFIIVRLGFKAGNEQVQQMPSVGELSYQPKTMEEKSKTRQFEEEKMEQQKKEMGMEENKYVIPDFRSLGKEETVSGENTVVTSKETEPKIKQKEIKAGSQNTEGTLKQKQTGHRPGFHSDYFSGKEKNTVPAVESPEQTRGKKIKNPFGTISAPGNPAQTNDTYYKAEIYGDQKIENGGNVLIRNTEAIDYNSILISKNSILYGQAEFRGNRVFIQLSRVKTPNGEFPIALSVTDNDRLEGIYYKAPIDESADKAKEDMDMPFIPGKYGAVINSVSRGVIRSGKELLNNNSLVLQDGYKLFIHQLNAN